MAFKPNYSEKRKLPRFTSADKGLESALNLLAAAIESITVPDINVSGGNIAWTNESVTITPPAPRIAPAGDTTLDPWEPTFTPSNVAGQWKVKFNLGTINGVVPTNWNDIHDLGNVDDIFKFVILTIITSSGAVSSCTISIAASAPATPDPVEEDSPPTSFTVVLGVVGANKAHMIWKTNLNAVGAVVFVTSISPAVGGEPFVRWWRWNVSAA